jgi:signal transduction histidine kinase/HAMP domain-containing protein
MTLGEHIRQLIGSSAQRLVACVVGAVGISTSVVFIAFSASAVELAAGVVTSLLLSVIAIVYLWSTLARPLQELRRASQAIAKGDPVRLADDLGNSDVNAVAASVNALGRRVRETAGVAGGMAAAETRASTLATTLNEVQLSYDHLLLVSELGQDIASSLNLDDILVKLYDKINSMMDAAIFAVGEYNEAGARVRFRLAIERSSRVAAFDIPMTAKDSFVVWSITHGKDVFLNNIVRDHARYVVAPPQSKTNGPAPRSIIVIPMYAKQRPIGVISVQSFHENAYTNYHVDMIKSLSLYTGAALENASAYEELGKALKTLRSAQEQLVQSEKMSSLGLLTAGIAHEINNPINFVSGNVGPLRRDIDDVVGIVRKYQEISTASDPRDALATVHEAAREIDLHYTMEEINTLLRGIEEGATRTAEIVRGLRNFSRLDENEIKSVDIHEGLDSTLTLLHNKYRDRIEIVKSYGELPKVDCFPGQLNQVFMNILSNAVQAIVDTGTITINTEPTAGGIKLSIHDSGMGMSDDIKKKIFDPFFTTKDVGVGTGLGLSITYGIIEKHNGRIDVESAPGKGTTFVITLPIHQPKLPSDA